MTKATLLLTGIKPARPKRDSMMMKERPIGRVQGVTKSSRDNPDHSVGAGRQAISAVKLSQELTAAIDAWAEAHRTVRSEAIRQLLELGLNAGPDVMVHGDDQEIEARAVKQITALLDPSLPAEERERRIRRLIDGPPEFSRQRIDLPRHEK
jgi:hypothetical protein